MVGSCSRGHSSETQRRLQAPASLVDFSQSRFLGQRQTRLGFGFHQCRYILCRFRVRFSQKCLSSRDCNFRYTDRQPRQFDCASFHHRLHHQKRKLNFHPRFRQISFGQQTRTRSASGRLDGDQQRKSQLHRVQPQHRRLRLVRRRSLRNQLRPEQSVQLAEVHPLFALRVLRSGQHPTQFSRCFGHQLRPHSGFLPPTRQPPIIQRVALVVHHHRCQSLVQLRCLS